jgi:hypothetical protein
LGKNDVDAAIDFIDQVAAKMIKSSHKALTKYLEDSQIHYNDERVKAWNTFSGGTRRS